MLIWALSSSYPRSSSFFHKVRCFEDRGLIALTETKSPVVTLEFSLLSSRNPVTGAVISEISGSLKITISVKTIKGEGANYTQFIEENDEVFSENWVLLGEEEMLVGFLEEVTAQNEMGNLTPTEEGTESTFLILILQILRPPPRRLKKGRMM